MGPDRPGEIWEVRWEKPWTFGFSVSWSGVRIILSWVILFGPMLVNIPYMDIHGAYGSYMEHMGMWMFPMPMTSHHGVRTSVTPFLKWIVSLRCHRMLQSPESIEQIWFHDLTNSTAIFHGEFPSIATFCITYLEGIYFEFHVHNKSPAIPLVEPTEALRWALRALRT